MTPTPQTNRTAGHTASLPPVTVTTPTAIVDCGSCSACCRRELVALIDGDDPRDFPEALKIPKEAVSPLLPTFLGYLIPHGSDGACIYLKDGRCSVYEKRPQMCRAFSCIGWVERILATTTRNERRRDRELIDTKIWRAGRKRIAARSALAAASEPQ